MEGGAEPPPSGPVVASQTARAPGVTAAQRRVSPQELGFCSEGRREEEGGFVQTGRVSLGKKKRSSRLMLCRTPRVFLSGGITSTFRQEQELEGKQQHG